MIGISVERSVEHLKGTFQEIRRELEAARRIVTERRRQLERQQITALRFEKTLIKYISLHNKAGFRRDQPRWPKGNGEHSGRWSGGAGTVESSAGTTSRKSYGHHLVPGEIYRKEPLKPETRQIFENETIGPLQSEKHNFGGGHSAYNEAVREAFERFKMENEIGRSEDVTAEQARKFVEAIRGSVDPRIRNFNMKIIMRELRFYIRRGRGTE